MQTEAFGAELKRMGFCDFVGVPCSYLAPLINWAINENVFVMANNEGEAVAIASGVSLACGNSSLRESALADSWQSTSDSSDSRGSILEEKSGLCEASNEIEQISSSRKRAQALHDFNPKDSVRKYGVVLMQNSGLSNALSPLTSLNHTFEIPILGFVSLRGEPNQAGQNTDEPQHELLGKITDKLLQTCQIECAFLDSRFEVACEQLAQAKKVLESNKSFFFIVRNSCFEKVSLTNNPLNNSSLRESRSNSWQSINESVESSLRSARSEAGATKQSISKNKIDCHDSTHSVESRNDEVKSTNAQKPTRLQSLQTIQSIGNDCALLATTGKCGRELYELGDRPNQLYMVGSMGCVSALGLGIALKSCKKVIAIDGDSALLMRLGTLSGNAYYAKLANKGNLCHILLDNQSHDSTGGQFNLSPFVDFVAIAKSCGYAVARAAQNLDEFSALLREFIGAKNGGAWFIYLQIAKGSKKDLGRPKITPKQVASRFGAWLNENLECADTHKL